MAAAPVPLPSVATSGGGGVYAYASALALSGDALVTGSTATDGAVAPTAVTARGHQFPMAFLMIAAGLVDHEQEAAVARRGGDPLRHRARAGRPRPLNAER